MKKKPDYPLIDLNSSPKPAKRSRVIQTPTSQSQITQTYGSKSNYPLLDLNSSPKTAKRVQVGQTSPSQCQITQATCSKTNYPLLDLNSSPKPDKRVQVGQTPTSQSQITQTTGCKPKHPLLDLNSSPKPAKRSRVFQTPTLQSQITQANVLNTNSSIPLKSAFSRVFRDITNLPCRNDDTRKTPTNQQQSFCAKQTHQTLGTSLPTSGLAKPSGCTPVPEENNCHIRNLQDAFANASFSPTDKADESTVEFTTPTISVSRKSVETKAVTQTINQPKKRGRPRKNVPTKRAAAKAKKTG
ncbi:predicted protein [Arabidopsis lyrata subsp. lyrata]|uniref:Predicted protein n=1 Tax=Arabidopsis lyrata subsp. lyrata TaxID=81972 RepID=D7MRV4_ARALL|nr:predicted protein [Arabidopsis lyrata subsp. lyrata]